MSNDPAVPGFPVESPEDRAQRVAKWKDARFELFLHWGPQKAGGESKINKPVLSRFNPTKFDAEQWVLTAKKTKFKYIVITTKHHSGFCMFDSEYTEHDIMDATPFGRDPMKQLADTSAKHDMLLGFYYSVWDIARPDYSKKIGRPSYAKHHQFMLDQTKELLTKHGDVVTLWMDGEWVNSWTYERASDYRDHVRKWQPELLLVDRIAARRSPFSAVFQEYKLGRVKLPELGRYNVIIKAIEITPKAIEYDQGLMMLREIVLSLEI